MKFTKMQGLGNDYVYVNCFQEEVKDPAALAKKISDRHFGIGSDGLILIGPSACADFEMRMYNADGSRGEMCGNGIRCVGKYVYDHGLTDQTRIRVETLAGVKELALSVADGKVCTVQVDMGQPELDPDRIPIRVDAAAGEDTARRCVNVPLRVGADTYPITGVSMGNPHAVVFVDDVEALDLADLGPKFEHHPWFPNRINTEFAQVLDAAHIRMRVWERGSGETFACGTGACAVAVAGVLNGLTNEEVTIHLLGGDLSISWDRTRDTVYMTGPAETVFEGEILI